MIIIQAIITYVTSLYAPKTLLFVFINRNKTMLRTLAYDGTGFWLMTKRLSKGKFKGWPNGHEPLSPVAAKQLRALIDRNDPNWMKA